MSATTDTATTGFPSPFSIESPEGAEGWERLYPYYMLFSDDRREDEEQAFWFHDSMHYPEPTYPFDTIIWENTWVTMNQNTTRVFMVPTALGVEHRVVNGYVYISPKGITDPDEIARRSTFFKERAGYYYEHWDELYDKWMVRTNECIDRLRAVEFPKLADEEPIEKVREGDPFTSGYQLLLAYNRLLEINHELSYLHFDMLGLGYGAYLTFRDFCQRAFPDMPEQAVAQMVAGIDLECFRPDDELKGLVRLARELGLDVHLKQGLGPEGTLAAIAGAPGGDQWIAKLEEVKEPWFWFSTGSGVSHADPSWMEDMSVPFTVMKTYAEKLDRGESLDRPLAELQSERERITAEYRELLPSDEDRAAFDQLVGLARLVFPYVENHNLYIDHRAYAIWWSKARALGEVFAHHGFFEAPEDLFLLHRYEVYQALWDLETGWASGASDRRAHWHRELAERKRIVERLRAWSPPPALGTAPAEVKDPYAVMLWGITKETIERWSDGQTADSGTSLRGVAASPGIAEGPARLITSPDELDQVEQGDVLVCSVTSPSWAPAFARISAAVSDAGGIMAHAAIVAREYGLPAVVGTGFGTQRIRSGQRVRVDGTKGLVTILDD
jgi:pyruvate,water dikinase